MHVARSKTLGMVVALAVGTSAFALGPSLVRAQAGRVVLDRVVAVVGDQIVLLSELERNTSRHPLLDQALSSLPRNASPKLVAQKTREVEIEVLDELVDLALLKAEAEKFDIRIETQDIVRYTADIAAKNQMSVDELRRQVEASSEYGSWTEYEAEVIDQLYLFKVPRYLASWDVSDAQVRDHYRKMTKGESAKVKVHQFIFNPASQERAARDRIFAQAQSVARRLRDGEKRDALVAELGDRASERSVSRGDIAPSLEDAVFAAKTEQVVGPLASGQGYVVFMVLEHIESAALSFEQAKVRIREQLEQEAYVKAQIDLRDKLRDKAHIDIRL